MSDEKDSNKEYGYIFGVDESNDSFIEDCESFINQVIEYIYKNVIWLTNLSLALLGFYIALLLQLKFNDIDITTFSSISSLISILLSVGIGLYLKLKREFTRFLNIGIDFFENSSVKSLRKGKNNIELNKILEKIEKMRLNIPSKLIKIQINCFIYSILFISIYLSKILFWN